MPLPELQSLLRALEERNIALGSQDVAWAFESAATKEETVGWVREYLDEACLLTLEEKTFAGKESQLAVKDVSACHAVSDQSFEDAITSLEASTQAIEKQSRRLEAQRQALQTIQQRNASNGRSGVPDGRGPSKVHRERSQLDFEASELADALHSNFNIALKEFDPNASSLQPTVERILEKDDRLLDGLEKILPHLQQDGGADDSDGDTDKLCQALKHFTSAGIRSRIDAAYLNGVQQHASQANGVNGKASREDRQLASMTAELEELCREIDGLAAMAVDAQHRQPIVNASSAAKSDAETQRAAWADYISATIQYSTARLDHMHDQLDDQRAHHNAMKGISAALDEVLAAGAFKPDTFPRSGPQSPTKASTQKGLKPLRLVQANLADTSDPATQLLRHLDVRLPAGELTSASLATISAQKTEQLATLSANTERSIAASIAQSLAESETDVRQLLRAVFVHSPFGGVRLEGEGVSGQIERLEDQTQRLSERMRALDSEGIVKATSERIGELVKREA